MPIQLMTVVQTFGKTRKLNGYEPIVVFFTCIINNLPRTDDVFDMPSI